MKFKLFLLTLIFCGTSLYAQDNIKLSSDIPLQYRINNSNIQFNSGTSSWEKSPKLFDSTGGQETTASAKSPGLAFLMSLLVPGTGQVYVKRFDVGKYYMISEAALWLAYASFTIYGNWLLNDAYSFAVIHAGIDRNNKPDQFFLDIANYDNVDIYNNDMLQQGQYDKLYYPEQGYGFYWDNVANRKIYRQDKLAADNTKHDRIFIMGAVLLNHAISAVSALFLANSYNASIKKSTGGWSMNAGVMQTYDRIDGLRLNFVKWF